MGYITDFTGRIEIDPPLPWAEVKNSPFLPDRARGKLDVKLVIDERSIETDEGTLIRREATAVEETYGDDSRGYDIVQHLQQLVDAHPGHAFTGYIEASGEESGDLWRLQVIDGRATKVHPRIVWPDGTEGPRR